jgi:hypothetical protein
MMEKVKLTPEQAEAIKTFCKTYNQQYWLEIFKNNKQIPDWEHEEMRVLTELSDEEFALAVCGWYEIEEPFKVGDWVKIVYDNKTVYGQIDTLAFDDVIANFSDGERRRVHYSEVERMTPEEIAAEKERRKWSSIGREVKEFRVGDIVIFAGEYFAELGPVDIARKNVNIYVDGEGYTSIPFDQLELVVPGEQRFDLKGDE